MYRIKSAEYLEDFKVRLKFSDGLEGIADLKDRVGRGGVFTQLANVDFFKALEIDPDTETITWPNGADISPEFLRERITGRV